MFNWRLAFCQLDRASHEYRLRLFNRAAVCALCFFLPISTSLVEIISVVAIVSGMIVGGMGLLGCVTTVIVGFIPPENFNIGSIFRYELTLVAGLLLMCCPPFISLALRNNEPSRLETTAV